MTTIENKMSIVNNPLFIALALIIIGNIFTWFQVNLQFLYEWWDNRPLFSIFAFSTPIGACFYFGWRYLVEHFDGNLWPARLISFGIGVIIFALLSYWIKGEALDKKTILCLFLSICIILIQTFYPDSSVSGKIEKDDAHLDEK